MNSQAHRINIAMTDAPQTLQDVSARSAVGNIARVRQNMRWLVKKGFAAQHSGNRWALTTRGMKLLDGHLLDQGRPTHRTPEHPFASQPTSPQVTPKADESFAEGRERLQLHRSLEQNRTLVQRKKAHVLQ
jgi:hypothetical protein